MIQEMRPNYFGEVLPPPPLRRVIWLRLRAMVRRWVFNKPPKWEYTINGIPLRKGELNSRGEFVKKGGE